jgi:tetratricopeptide (TPR) repeat protein
MILDRLDILQVADKYNISPLIFIRKIESLYDLNNLVIQKSGYFYTIGDILFQNSYFYLSLQTFKIAVNHFMNDHDREGELNCYLSIGGTYFRLGNYHKVIEYLQKALKISIKANDKTGEMNSCGNIGILYRHLGDYKKAIKFSKRALTLAINNRDKFAESDMNLNLGRTYFDREQIKIAYNYFKRSIEVSDSIGEKIIKDNDKVGFYAISYRSKAYEYMISICLSLRKEKEALEYTERSKAKAFLDMLAKGKTKLNTNPEGFSLGIGKALSLTEIQDIIRQEENILLVEFFCMHKQDLNFCNFTRWIICKISSLI